MECTPNFSCVSITSGDRVSGTPHDCVIRLNQNMVFDNIEEIILQSFSWLMDANKINSAYNTIPFDEGGTPAFAILASGNYNLIQNLSPQDLCNAIKLAMDAASPNGYIYTVTYSVLTGRITISSTGAFSLLWATGTGDRSRFISYTLGFGIYTLAADYGPALSITAPGTAVLTGPAGLLISVERVFEKCLTTTDGRAATWFVPVNNSTGTASFIYNSTPFGGRVKCGFNSGKGTAVQLRFKIETQDKSPNYPLNEVLNDWKMTWIIKNRVGTY